MAKTYTIKPLVWKDQVTGDAYARTSIANVEYLYSVYQKEVKKRPKTIVWQWSHGWEIHQSDSLDAAKAAAEAHWVAFLEQALEEVK